jgi:hypothetical protein
MSFGEPRSARRRLRAGRCSEKDLTAAMQRPVSAWPIYASAAVSWPMILACLRRRASPMKAIEPILEKLD